MDASIHLVKDDGKRLLIIYRTYVLNWVWCDPLRNVQSYQQGPLEQKEEKPDNQIHYITSYFRMNSTMFQALGQVPVSNIFEVHFIDIRLLLNRSSVAAADRESEEEKRGNDLHIDRWSSCLGNAMFLGVDQSSCCWRRRDWRMAFPLYMHTIINALDIRMIVFLFAQEAQHCQDLAGLLILFLSTEQTSWCCEREELVFGWWGKQ